MSGEDAAPPPSMHVPGWAIAEALRRAIAHTGELLAAPLEVTALGATVPIVCVGEVEGWLRTLASRAELGDDLTG